MREIVLNEYIPAIPSTKVLDKKVFNRVKEVILDLKRKIDNPSDNKKLYDFLVLQKSDYTKFIEIFPGYSIPVIFKSRSTTGINLGGTSYLPDKSNICIIIALEDKTWGVAGIRRSKSGTIVYKDEYLSILIHEMTHVMQLLDVAVRYLKMKNISINKNTLVDMMIALLERESNSRGFEAILSGGKYYREPKELGANAHALIDVLAANKGIEAIETVVSYVDTGRPSFREIDDAMRKVTQGKIPIWNTLDKMINLEMEIGSVSREEWTEGYKIKNLLLKVISEFYKRHYK